MDTDKIIVTNKKALDSKYGNKTSKIISALNKLVASDKQKGLNSKLIFLDDSNSMKTFRSRVVKNFSVAKENKNAIDDLYTFFSPDYVMIVGAWDIVPHVRLKNIIAKKDDDDRLINSDLPYACEAPYSNSVGNFLSPSRVIGRLPDIVGGNDESYLVKLIDNIIASAPGKISDYSSFFSVSAKVWKGSTSQSLQYLFPDISSLKLCPAAAGPYLKSDLNHKIHFFNCHGAIAEPEFYGQSGDNYPVSFQSDFINGNIQAGTVVAAECCYGADLYHPRTGSSKMGIANTYLANNALGFVGSTTIAYGPATGQGSADYITQFFVKGVQKGSSLGRSFLEARQKFIEMSAPKFDPIELKTIAQFILLGDPSVQLVEIAGKNIGVEDGTSGEEHDIASKSKRKDRRLRLTVKGVLLGEIAHAPHPKKTRVSPLMKKKLHKILRQHNFNASEGSAFEFRPAKGVFKKLDKSVVRYHLFTEHVQPRNEFQKIKKTKIIIIKELDAAITEVRKYERK